MKYPQEQQRFRVLHWHWDHFGDQQLHHDETRTDRPWSANWASARILVMNLSAVIAPWWGYVSKDDLSGWNLRSLLWIRLAHCDRFSVGRSSFIDFPEWFLCSRSEGEIIDELGKSNSRCLTGVYGWWNDTHLHQVIRLPIYKAFHRLRFLLIFTPPIQEGRPNCDR